jgi:endo-1,3-1,4-beta-glycanase ExoK
MQLRARSLKDAAAQGAHLASFWVMRARAKVKAAERAFVVYAAPRLARAAGLARAWGAQLRADAQPYVQRAQAWARAGAARAAVAYAAASARVAAAAITLDHRTRAFRLAAEPYAVGAALAAGGAVVLAPALLMAGAAVSVLIYAPPRAAVIAAPATESLPPYVNFLERFHTIDEERWQVSDGWDNGYWNWSDWRRSALHPSSDGLAIIMAPNPPGSSKPFAGGELQSQEQYRYGYYEVRMRVPRGDGLVVGFFTYTMPDGKASQQEIDIEFVGSRRNMIEFGYHLGRHSEAQRVHLPFDATEGFHTYAFEWTPEGIRWFVDNRLTHVYNNDRTRALTAPERLYLSLSASRIAVWTGELDRSQAPWRLDVSCVVQAREYRGQSLCAR